MYSVFYINCILYIVFIYYKDNFYKGMVILNNLYELLKDFVIYWEDVVVYLNFFFY